MIRALTSTFTICDCVTCKRNYVRQTSDEVPVSRYTVVVGVVVVVAVLALAVSVAVAVMVVMVVVMVVVIVEVVDVVVVVVIHYSVEAYHKTNVLATRV